MLKLLCSEEISANFEVASPESSPSSSGGGGAGDNGGCGNVRTSKSHGDLNAKDREGNTPLHHLVSTCHVDIVDLLWLMLQNGADPSVQVGPAI